MFFFHNECLHKERISESETSPVVINDVVFEDNSDGEDDGEVSTYRDKVKKKLLSFSQDNIHLNTESANDLNETTADFSEF